MATGESSTLRKARTVVVAVVGGTVTLFGVALLVLPGPGLVVIALGLSILASEFVWARHFLHKVRETIANATKKSS